MSKLNSKIFLLVSFIFLIAQLKGQRIYDDNDPIVSFGIQVSSIFSNNLLNVRTASVVQGSETYGVEPVLGFSFGGVVNLRMSNRFYLLTGINMLRRDYDGFQIKDGNRSTVRFRTTTYEIPILASYYLRLTDRALLNVSSGIPLHFTPTDLFARSENLEALSLKLGVFKPVFSTIVGVEYRTPYSGGLYLGAQYNIAPWALFVTRLGERDVPFVDGAFIEQIGDFFGIVARYYLP